MQQRALQLHLLHVPISTPHPFNGSTGPSQAFNAAICLARYTQIATTQEKAGDWDNINISKSDGSMYCNAL
jgi:hypothetical protein